MKGHVLHLFLWQRKAPGAVEGMRRRGGLSAVFGLRQYGLNVISAIDLLSTQDAQSKTRPSHNNTLINHYGIPDLITKTRTIIPFTKTTLNRLGFWGTRYWAFLFPIQWNQCTRKQRYTFLLVEEKGVHNMQPNYSFLFVRNKCHQHWLRTLNLSAKIHNKLPRHS